MGSHHGGHHEVGLRHADYVTQVFNERLRRPGEARWRAELK
jgi:hypothetical protein